MPRSNGLITSFSGGEISPKLRRRSEIEGYSSSAEYQENMISELHGPLRFREGTEFKGTLPYADGRTYTSDSIRFMPFIYDSVDTYIIELTPFLVRFWDNNGDIVSDETATIEYVEKRTNQLVVHLSGTSGGFGQTLGIGTCHFTGITNSGYELLNHRHWDVTANNVSTVNGAWREVVFTYTGATVSAAEVVTGTVTATSHYVLNNTMAATEIPFIQWAQKNDTMYIVSNGTGVNPRPQQLVRTNATPTFVWSSATFVGYDETGTIIANNGPFSGSSIASLNDHPRCICFFENRLYLANATHDPFENQATGLGSRRSAFDVLWGSDVDIYTNFQQHIGGATDANGLDYKLAYNNDEIVRLIPTKDFLYVHTLGGAYSARGSTPAGLTNSDINVRQIHGLGAFVDTDFIIKDEDIIFIERTSRKVRKVEYDFDRDKYIPVDLSRVSEHFGDLIFKRIEIKRGRDENIFITTEDGISLMFTYDAAAGINGWARFTSAGTTIDSIGSQYDIMSIPNGSENDTTLMAVSRGDDIYVEKIIDRTAYEDDLKNYRDTESAQEKIVEGVEFEKQIRDAHLDAQITYDAKTATTMTFANGGVSGTTTCTAGAGTFVAGDVGRRIIGMRSDDYLTSGTSVPYGVAEITGFTSATVVDVEIVEAFDDLTGGVLPTGNGYFEKAANSTVNSLAFESGAEISIFADGHYIETQTLDSSGVVTISVPWSLLVLGFRYRGIWKSVNLQAGSNIGPSDHHEKNLGRVGVKFYKTLNAKIGSDIRKLETVQLRQDDNNSNFPTRLVDDEVTVNFEGNWTKEKHLYVVVDEPGPCTIQALAPYFEISDD